MSDGFIAATVREGAFTAPEPTAAAGTAAAARSVMGAVGATSGRGALVASVIALTGCLLLWQRARRNPVTPDNVVAPA
jgi:hypothetical protein